MESIRSLLFFIFGISLLPKIYSVNYSSLFITKQTHKNYAVADEIQYVEDQNNVLIFSTSPEYRLFSACPEEKALQRRPDALKVQRLVVDFEPRPLQEFFTGHFIEYNCLNQIKPIVLKSNERFESLDTTKYDIGFLIHENNADFGELWKKYPVLPKLPGYDFIPLLSITMNRQLGTIMSVQHRIISRGLLQPDSHLDLLPPYEKNADVYGFNINSLYEKENQQKMFSSIFGQQYSRYYDHQEDRYLVKVQLAPYEDFLLHTWRLPSFMDLNTVPMWTRLYSQWGQVEMFIRKVARELEPLIVETGAAKILTLPVDKNNSQSVYLREGGKFLVPNYFYKLIKFKQFDDDASTQAVLIVMHNDPYTQNQKPICNDASKSLGWKVSNKNYKTGLTYVCPVNEKITTKLHDEYKVNYTSLNLNNMKKLETAKNDIFPSLFIIKNPNTSYIVANKFEYVEGQENIVKFSTPPRHELYNACPEENASVYRKYTLKLQEPVTAFEPSPLQQFVEGNFVKYNCRSPIKPAVLKTKNRFIDKSEFEYHTGFLIHKKNENFAKLSGLYENFTEKQEYIFFPFLKITLDMKVGTIAYVIHRITSRELLEPDSAYSSLFQQNEKNVDVYGFDVNYLYTEENQQKMFSLIFGKVSSRYYDYPVRCLIKVQLAPHEDFLLDTWKLTSLVDLNTAAMWKQLHAKWRTIEIFVRNIAIKLGTLTVETGAAKILTLPGVKNKSQSVYLREEGKSPVPKYFYKEIKLIRLYDTMVTRAILIVMHNDPYTQNQEQICDDVGESLGWTVSNNDFETGLTYVCPVNENITVKLHPHYKSNFDSLDLNNVQKDQDDENEIFPSLFLLRKDAAYVVADEFEYVEGQNNVLKFSISRGYQLYNACPEEDAPFYPTYTLVVQEMVTDFEPSPLQQFVEGDFIKYNCRNPIRPVVLKTKKRFADEFVGEYDVGFLIRDKNATFDEVSELYDSFSETREHGFLLYLTIRMNQRSGTILQTSHQVTSKGLLEPDPAYSGAPWPYKKNVDVYGYDVNTLYTEENQAKVFSSFFPEQNCPYYSYPNQSLRKVQLAPLEDFQLNIWKLPSLIDLNTTAMWEQLYLQWKRIEVFVREVVRKLETLTIATGAAKILTLADVNGQQKPVYLREEQKSPVHKYIWKLIKFEQLDDEYYTQAILIIMHNDPYTPDQKPICGDVSESLGWMVSNQDNKTGLTYVCQVVGNIMSKLHDEFGKNYASLNLNDVQKLKYGENDTFPSLFIIKKPNNIYTVADKFEYVEGQDNVLKFSESREEQLYNACPEKYAPFHPTYTLKVQELVNDFKARPLQQFIKGDFGRYNCWYPIKPIVLKSKLKFKDEFAVQYDIGFLIQAKNANFNKLSEKYENFTEIQEYDFLHFLAITMDRQSGMILSVLHRIISKGLLQPESAYSVPFQPNEKNIDIYGFNVNSLYAEENQQKMFSSIFGQSYTNYYNPPKQRLRKVQLAPYEDFLLNTWKLPSFTDLNTAAMWEQLLPQWRRIEIFVRKVAREMDSLTIETGAARILSLPDAEGKHQPVYLREEKKSPVPKYFWKLIKFDQSDHNNDEYSQAILIVMHNDPYNQNQKPICDDVSKNWGWMVSNKDYKKGLTYGCKVVGNITRELHDEYNENYEDFDLKSVHTLGNYNNGLTKWLKKNIYAKVMSCS